MLYDTKKRKCGETSIPLNLNDWGYPSGTKLETILERELIRRNPSNGNFVASGLKKLGKYNYFVLLIYDVDVKGGYDKPAKYYFRLK